MVNLLPKNMPVLATTATATARVQQDIERQIGGQLTTVRGNLMRDNFHLYVVETQSEEEKMVALSRWMDRLPGTGLIYTGTRVQTELYARWLEHNGISCIAYNAGLTAEQRKEIEQGLMENRWKCITSTNALGMGIDKPDIRFIIHTQIPASPIHYYQEIGRAGRDGKPTVAILFYNSLKDADGIPEDYKLPKSFIESARPSVQTYQRVINLLKDEPLGVLDLTRRTNLKQTPVRVIKADLIEQGIIKEVIYDRRKVYEYQYGAGELDTAGFKALRAAKLKDLDKMVEYVYTDEPRMKFLCEYLGDRHPNVYKGCDNTDLVKRHVCMKEEDWQRIRDFLTNYFPQLEVESNKTNLINGVAGAYYGTSNIGTSIHRCKYEDGGMFPDMLLKTVLRAYRNQWGSKTFDMILYVPPTVSGDLVKDFAYRLGSTLSIPVHGWLQKIHPTEPQKIFQNSMLKRDNVAGAFTLSVPDAVEGMSVLLIDDIFDSGATIKEIGRMLTQAGATVIAPLVIAKAVGGDKL